MIKLTKKKETMQTDTQKTTQQYQKSIQSNAQIDDLYRKIENNERNYGLCKLERTTKSNVNG